MRTSNLCGPALFLLSVGTMAGGGGCIVDDNGGTRGQANAPTATVPDAGSPIRRESAAKTLNDADPEPPAAADGDTLQVEPAPGRVPPPPVQ